MGKRMGIFNWLRRGRFDAVDAFAQFVARERPQWQVRGVAKGALQIAMTDDGTAQLNIDRIREMAGRGPENSTQCQEAFRQLLSILDSMEREHQPLSLATDRHRLRPRLVPDEYYQMMKKGPAPVARRLHELGLWIIYALDSEHSVSFLSEAQLGQLGIDEDQLHAIAMQNLANEKFTAAVQSVVREKKAINFKFLDSYDAARLLLVPESLEDGHVLGACIPDRDTLFLCPAPENDAWSALAEVAKIPASDRLILDRPVRVTRQGFELR